MILCLCLVVSVYMCVILVILFMWLTLGWMMCMLLRSIRFISLKWVASHLLDVIGIGERV